ncbi:MAG: hypothetical protein Q8P56_03740 [Candidatus Uhrbacteria bacterium]|nr:hypothetical protein [Candidatus Uhrbacteria bacterium]
MTSDYCRGQFPIEIGDGHLRVKDDSRVRRCAVTRDGYLRDVVTLPFVRRVIQEIVYRVIGTDDFLSLEEFKEFLTLQFLASPEAEIETTIVVRSDDDILLNVTGGTMRAFLPLEINITFEREQFSACVPLRGFAELEGSSQKIEWHNANVRIQLPTHKTFDFAVHDKMWQLDVFEVLSIEEENQPMKKKKS